jgi:glucose/arabinose dehydrogenase
LVHPWGMDFLPDGRLLVTERPGRLRILQRDGRLSQPLAGTPEVFARGQGGMLDVAVDPEFAKNRLVDLSFSEPGSGGASTALGRGRLAEDRIEGFQVIFRQEPKVSGPNHFGSRIVFAPDGKLFLTTGERYKFEPAQDVSSHLGKIIRINRDGSTPQDNPLLRVPGAKPEIWSYGHRNIQAAAINPQTGALWVAEMGPRGGDELNVPEPGRNYGWPLVSWGTHYDGTDIPNPPTRPDLADAIKQWTPVISPSGMIFYTGNLFPTWRGNALIGSLSRRGLVRIGVSASNVTGEEIIPLGARIRDVEQGPDGAVYLLTDHQDGHVLRLRPQR